MIWKNGLRCATCGGSVSAGRGCLKCSSADEAGHNKPRAKDSGGVAASVPGSGVPAPGAATLRGSSAGAGLTESSLKVRRQSQFTWGLSDVEDYDGKVVSLSGTCDPGDGNIVIVIMHTGSSGRLWQCPPEVTPERKGASQTLSIEISRVGQIMFNQVERTKIVRSGDSVTEKKIHAFQVGVRVGETRNAMTLFEGLDFLQARILTERLSRACDADIADKTGDKLVVRKREDIDRPLYEILEKPRSMQAVPQGIEWGKVADGWMIEWSEGHGKSVNPKAMLTRKLVATMAGLVLLSAIFLDGVAWSALLVTILGSAAAVGLGVSGRRFKVNGNSVIYSEGPLLKSSVEHSMPLGTLEQIHLATGTGAWEGGDSVSLISDKVVLTIPGTGERLSFIKKFLEAAIFDLKRGGGALPPKAFKPYGIFGGISKTFGFLGVGLPVLGAIVFLWGLFISPAKDPVVGLSPVPSRGQGVFAGTTQIPLDAHGYEGKVTFSIPNSYGTEGDFDYKFSILEPDGSPILTLENEYYLEEWYEESMISTVTKSVFGFGLPEAGKYVLSAEVRVDPASRDLLGKARTVAVRFTDYRYPYRLAFFICFAAVFVMGLAPAPVTTLMSAGIRVAAILFLLYLTTWAVFTTSEPEVSLAPRGTVSPAGHTGVYVHMYRPYSIHHRGFFSGRGGYGRGGFGGGSRGGRGFRSGTGGGK